MTEFLNFLSSQSDERFAGVLVALVALMIIWTIGVVHVVNAISRIKMSWPKFTRQYKPSRDNSNEIKIK